jgi:transketolase
MAKITNEELKSVADTIRGLAMDGVQKAKSGHPGMPMGMADVASVLYLNHLKHCPSDPAWFDRDRFVLSAGHGSMLLYSLLHLSGYDLPLEELAAFRQLGSLTPGHPEHGHTAGVETTTGPLGQGCGNGVGMALAERMLAARFNTEDCPLVDHYTYVLAGDGDMMEGLSHESFSLAGHLGLHKLVVFYDDNQITIEGSTELAYSDDVRKRFQGYRWNVIETDAHDFDAVDKAIRKAKRQRQKPTLIICKSRIGKGSPNKEGSADAHGAPLGEEEVRATKRNLGLPEDRTFYVPDSVRQLFRRRESALKRQAARWRRMRDDFTRQDPEKARLWEAHLSGELPADIYSVLPEFPLGKAVATRSASGKVIQALARAVPHLVGGSADLAPSTKTLMEGIASVGPDAFAGRNLHFGVREHAMAALLNGMALHGGFRVFGATFFVFLDYCRPSVRLASIMKLPVVYVFTHDSFYVGEDGPTHEPVEHLASLRCIPGMTVIRPADPTETGAAWVAALKNTTGPTALALTRHDIEPLDRSVLPPASLVEKGAYTLWQSKPDAPPDAIVIASGSEVCLALQTARAMADEANLRVVSMPSWELFERQSPEYRETVLPRACPRRIAVEAGCSMGWEKYIGASGHRLCLDRFGVSGPYKELAREFGFTPEHLQTLIRECLGTPARDGEQS